MSGPLRFLDNSVPGSGGIQVATVNMSTSFRMKKRGNVPPRLDTLGDVSDVIQGVNLREIKTYVASRVI